MLVSHETLCKIRENREITYSSYVQVTVTNAISIRTSNGPSGRRCNLMGLKSQVSSEQPMHRTSIGAVLAELSVVGSTLEAPVEVSGVFPVDVDILI